MLLKSGEKVHVMHHTFFEKGGNRTMLGIVEVCEHGVIRVRGHIFMTDPTKSLPMRQSPEVTRFFTLLSGDFIVTPLPNSLDLDKLAYRQSTHGLQLTDGGEWQLDLSSLNLR